MKMLILCCDVGGRADYAAISGIYLRKGDFGKVGKGGPRLLLATYLDQMRGVGYLELARGMLDLISYYVHTEGAYVVPVVDGRGVGAGVVEILAESSVHPLALMATTGFHEHHPKPILGNTALQLSVSNSSLLTAIRTARANGEFKVDATLDFADELARQMMNVEPQLTAKKKSERFDAPTGQHDDLLAATMMALYVAVRLDSADRGLSLMPWMKYIGVGRRPATERQVSSATIPVGAWT